MPTHRLIPYNTRYINEIVDFWSRNEYFKGQIQPALKKHLLWKYNKKFTKVWIVEKQGTIIGSCGRTMTKFLSNGKLICNGPCGIDSLVDGNLSDEERRHVFLKVYRRATFDGLRRNEPEVGFCFPNHVVRRMYLNTVWMDVPVFFKYSIDARTLCLQGNSGTGGLQLSLIKKFEPSWDGLWITFSKSFSLCVLRDHSYLNWRYCQNPDRKYMVFLAKSGGEIKGYVVLREAARGGRKTGHIVDFLAEDKSSGLENALINKVLAFLSERGCFSIDVCVSHARHRKLFEGMGFRKERIDFFVFRPYPNLFKNNFKNKDRWSITSGDGDFEMES